jgi:D-tyrosyl-tRNA(Tyr) deacylase
MITVVQRVKHAAVHVDGGEVARIAHGALLLVAVQANDTAADAEATAHKIGKLRFFPGATPMDKTLGDVAGSCLVVSQFTLAGDVAKGNRPSFTAAASPELGEQLYLRVADTLRALGIAVALGRFRAHMHVTLENDGPVTFLVKSHGGRIQ